MYDYNNLSLILAQKQLENLKNFYNKSYDRNLVPEIKYYQSLLNDYLEGNTNTPIDNKPK